jgi:hypothetical protein
MIPAGGPFFDDLEVGDLIDTAPALTLTAGHAAAHQAIVCGSRSTRRWRGACSAARRRWPIRRWSATSRSASRRW